VQAVEDRFHPLPPGLAPEAHPVVELEGVGQREPFEELAPPGVHGPLEVGHGAPPHLGRKLLCAGKGMGKLGGGWEALQIQLEIRGEVERDGVALEDEMGFLGGPRERGAQPGRGAGQGGPAGGLVAVGPEEGRQLVSGMGAAFDQRVGEDREGFAGREGEEPPRPWRTSGNPSNATLNRATERPWNALATPRSTSRRDMLDTCLHSGLAAAGTP